MDAIRVCLVFIAAMSNTGTSQELWKRDDAEDTVAPEGPIIVVVPDPGQGIIHFLSDQLPPFLHERLHAEGCHHQFAVRPPDTVPRLKMPQLPALSGLGGLGMPSLHPLGHSGPPEGRYFWLRPSGIIGKTGLVTTPQDMYSKSKEFLNVQRPNLSLNREKDSKSASHRGDNTAGDITDGDNAGNLDFAKLFKVIPCGDHCPPRHVNPPTGLSMGTTTEGFTTTPQLLEIPAATSQSPEECGELCHKSAELAYEVGPDNRPQKETIGELGNSFGYTSEDFEDDKVVDIKGLMRNHVAVIPPEESGRSRYDSDGEPLRSLDRPGPLERETEQSHRTSEHPQSFSKEEVCSGNCRGVDSVTDTVGARPGETTEVMGTREDHGSLVLSGHDTVRDYGPTEEDDVGVVPSGLGSFREDTSAGAGSSDGKDYLEISENCTENCQKSENPEDGTTEVMGTPEDHGSLVLSGHDTVQDYGPTDEDDVGVVPSGLGSFREDTSAGAGSSDGKDYLEISENCTENCQKSENPEDGTTEVMGTPEDHGSLVLSGHDTVQDYGPTDEDDVGVVPSGLGSFREDTSAGAGSSDGKDYLETSENCTENCRKSENPEDETTEVIGAPVDQRSTSLMDHDIAQEDGSTEEDEDDRVAPDGLGSFREDTSAGAGSSDDKDYLETSENCTENCQKSENPEDETTEVMGTPEDHGSLVLSGHDAVQDYGSTAEDEDDRVASDGLGSFREDTSASAGSSDGKDYLETSENCTENCQKSEVPEDETTEVIGAPVDQRSTSLMDHDIAQEDGSTEEDEDDGVASDGLGNFREDTSASAGSSDGKDYHGTSENCTGNCQKSMSTGQETRPGIGKKEDTKSQESVGRGAREHARKITGGHPPSHQEPTGVDATPEPINTIGGFITEAELSNAPVKVSETTVASTRTRETGEDSKFSQNLPELEGDKVQEKAAVQTLVAEEGVPSVKGTSQMDISLVHRSEGTEEDKYGENQSVGIGFRDYLYKGNPTEVANSDHEKSLVGTKSIRDSSLGGVKNTHSLEPENTSTVGDYLRGGRNLNIFNYENQKPFYTSPGIFTPSYAFRNQYLPLPPLGYEPEPMDDDSHLQLTPGTRNDWHVGEDEPNSVKSSNGRYNGSATNLGVTSSPPEYSGEGDHGHVVAGREYVFVNGQYLPIRGDGRQPKSGNFVFVNGQYVPENVDRLPTVKGIFVNGIYFPTFNGGAWRAGNGASGSRFGGDSAFASRTGGQEFVNGQYVRKTEEATSYRQKAVPYDMVFVNGQYVPRRRTEDRSVPRSGVDFPVDDMIFVNGQYVPRGKGKAFIGGQHSNSNQTGGSEKIDGGTSLERISGNVTHPAVPSSRAKGSRVAQFIEITPQTFVSGQYVPLRHPEASSKLRTDQEKLIANGEFYFQSGSGRIPLVVDKNCSTETSVCLRLPDLPPRARSHAKQKEEENCNLRRMDLAANMVKALHDLLSSGDNQTHRGRRTGGVK
ncbi:hypothetical protein AAG570_008094 [Ranatra chinensis]|uniref:Uncharacterized protein n=1 Tax=Ranatra chinensis TaxID=642074 RepID=A0ABD0XTR3_9HEMI